MGHQGKDETEDVYAGQHGGDLFAQKLESLGMLHTQAGLGAEQMEIHRRHDEADRGQGQQRRAQSRIGAVEFLLAVKKTAGDDRDAHYE